LKKFSKIPTPILLAQIIAIILWFVISVIQWVNNPKGDSGWVVPIIIRATEAISIFIVSGILILILENINITIRKIYLWFLIIVMIYPGALISAYLGIQLRSIVGYGPPVFNNYFFIQSLHYYTPILLVIIFYLIVKNQVEAQKEKEEKLRAEGRAQEAKWMMLRYQINPHFLFNSLNTIKALVGNDDEKARKLITEMSEYFRYSLSSGKNPLVNIKEEINAVDNYLEIQKLRFQEKLSVTKKIDKNTLDYSIPVFAIQTLVENAIKYGLKTNDSTVNICIETYLSDKQMTISVSNSGKLYKNDSNFKDENGTSTGIENLKNRLSFVDKEYSFNLSEKDDKVIAKIVIAAIKK